MFQGQQNTYLNMNVKLLVWKIMFYRLGKSGVGHQSRGGFMRLCFSAVGINWGHGWFVRLHLRVFSLWETWEFLESGVLPFLSPLVPYLFSCSPVCPSFALFHNQNSSFPPFSYRDTHFSYSFNNMERCFLEKMWGFLSEECIAKCLSKGCH